MALIVRKTESAAETHQTLRVVEFSLPSPLKHGILFRGTVSWGERVLIALQQRFPRELFAFNGNNLFHDHKTRVFIHATNRKAVEARELSNEESLEDAGVHEVMCLTLNTIIDQRLKYLSPFGVNSEAELREKQWRLVEIKNQSIRAYFAKTGREMRRKIDEALVPKKLEESEIRIFNQYWKFNLGHPWGAERHLQIEQENFELYKKAISDTLAYVRSRADYLFKTDFGAHLSKALATETRKVRQNLLEKISKTQDPKRVTELNYQILKGQLLTPPLIRYVLRQVLDPLIKKTVKEVSEITQQKLQEAQKEIEELEEDLRSFKCCIDSEGIQNHFGTSMTPEMIAPILEVNQKYREMTTNILSRLKAKTDQNFRFEAQVEWGYSAAEMSKVLKDELDSHRKAIQALMLVLGLKESIPFDASTSHYDPDLEFDLDSMLDPVEFFETRYQQRDVEALTLLQQKTDEVKS